jgi:hydroxymethylglutaryl-CoA reductase
VWHCPIPPQRNHILQAAVPVNTGEAVVAAVAVVEAEQTNMVDPTTIMPLATIMPRATITEKIMPRATIMPLATITETMGMNMVTKAVEKEKGHSTEVVVRRLSSEGTVATPWLNEF